MNKSIFVGAGVLMVIGTILGFMGEAIIGNIWAVGGVVLMWIGFASKK